MEWVFIIGIGIVVAIQWLIILYREHNRNDPK